MCRLLKAFDLICLTNALFTSYMLIRTFGIGAESGFSWHYQLPMLLYGCMNVTQMTVLLLKPDVHQAYRFQVGSRSLSGAQRMLQCCFGEAGVLGFNILRSAVPRWLLGYQHSSPANSAITLHGRLNNRLGV